MCIIMINIHIRSYNAYALHMHYKILYVYVQLCTYTTMSIIDKH